MEYLSASSQVGELERLCQEYGIRRFSAAEMVELLQDGESVEWLVAQALPGADPDAGSALAAVLAQIAAEVAPPPTEPETQDEEAGIDPGSDSAATGVEAAAVAPSQLDWEQLKDVPLPQGVDLGQLKKLLASPQGELLADFSAFCQEHGVNADAGGEGMEERLRELHEEWLQTPRDALSGRTPSEALSGGRLFPQKVETFRREVPKVGRNDPCPCGSGRKYKKCCGKE
jgi:hypothetical protein